MSYRSIKRVLGETSLERKCRFLFGACLLLLITGSFWWYGQQTEKLVHKLNREKGRLLIDTLMALHDEDVAKPEVTSESIRPLKRSSGANLSQSTYDWSFLRSASTEGVEPLDEMEWRIVDQFEKEGGPEYADYYPPERDEYQYFQPVRATSDTCVGCHQILWQRPDLARGDVLAIVKVRIPNGPTQRDLNRNRAVLLATAIITVFLAMIAAYVIVRYVIVKPLKHLRDVSDAISHGDIDMRADIHTADEFEELGVAFNRMLRHLVAVQQELREVNGDLDGKIDELAQANLRLFETNRLKSDFLATMSHELRTPLNSIIGFSDVLGSIKSLDEKQLRYVLNIQKSGKILLDMINEVLDLAKIESGKMEVRLSDFRIEHLIDAQCDMARPLTERKNIDLDVVIAAGLPEMHQDQGKVQQVLNNLLSNAIKFTPEGGRIIVSAARNEAGDLMLTVSDTGVGIAEEDQVTVFEKFRQGSSLLAGGDAMTREYSGTGLGLSIVKELTKLLGGEISLESELGKGSTFRVRLPWALAERPRLDTPLPETLADLTKLRRGEFERRAAEAQPAAHSRD